MLSEETSIPETSAPRGSGVGTVSTFTIVKVFLVGLAFFLAYKLRAVLVMLFVALVLAALIDPFADWFAKRRVPRSVSVIGIYVILLGLIASIIILLVPPILGEFSALVRNFSSIWNRMSDAFVSVRALSAQYGIAQTIERGLQSVEDGLYDTVRGALGTIRGIFGGIIRFLITMVLAFYMVVEEQSMRKLYKSIAPERYHAYIGGLLPRVQEKIGRWLRGELVLMLMVGVSSYVGLLILGVDYALILGLLAGLAEIIPYAGPIIGAVPAVLLAFTQSPVKALFVIILYFAIQQIENHLLVPKVMQRAVGLNPVVSILALLVGAELGGIAGAVMAIPVATAISVVLHDFLEMKQRV